MDSSLNQAAARLPTRPTRADYIVGLVLTAAILGETYGADIPGARWLLTLCGIVQGVALFWRRTLPWAVPVVEAVALGLPALSGTPSDDSSTFGLVALVFAVFAMGRYGLVRPEDRTRTFAAWVVTLGIAWGTSIYQSGLRVSDMIFIALFAVGPLVFGRAISVSQSAQMQAEVLNERLVEQGEQLRHQAVQDERERIARELHDVIAHSVSLMGLQAGAARTVLTPGNEEAARSLRSVEETGRDTLNELRRMLGVMHSNGGEDDLAPQPGLGSLPGVVARHRDSGVAVELSLGEGLDGLSPGVDLAAFRIVQEALTNSVRHAPDSPVTIEVGTHGGVIELKIVSREATPGSEDSSATGHGIVGMNERAGLYGGKVSAEFIEGEGFVVMATLHADYLTVEEPVAQR